MKLQIINRLSINSRENFDTIPTVRRESQLAKNKDYTQLNNNHYEFNYYSIDTHHSNNYGPKCYPQTKMSKNIDSHKEFFSNFNSLCTVKYEQVSRVEAKHRRKLQQQLRMLMMSKSSTPKNEQIFQKLLIIQDNKQARQKTKKMSSPLQMRNYYLGQNRMKDKIRKINSLVSIRTEQSAELSRKPGFILKKNNSLMKRQSTEQLTLIQDPYPNKQNVNPNKVSQIQGLKHSGSNVDRQILQSKQRIARIRQQLNQIYEMRKEPNRCKLRLF